MVLTRTDYTEAAVRAARSVLLELIHLLGEYKDDIVICMILPGWKQCTG